jgi:transglutaminase-like putative cysteine protease
MQMVGVPAASAAALAWRIRMLGALMPLMLVLPAATATAKDVAQIGPTPGWVTVVAADMAAEAPLGQVSDGSHYLLTDHQVRLEPGQRIDFRHSAQKALNDKGVDAIANIEIEFDPAFQQLSLHTLKVHRDGQVESRLGRTRVKLLQRERDLAYRIFDGSQTASLVLDDVRPGDVVELAYSVRGANPVFGNRLFGRVDLQWGVPVHHVYRRVSAAVGRELQFKAHHFNKPPVTREIGGYREYVWERHSVPALPRENNLPRWFDPWPKVQWSEFDSWADVATWAAPLYALPPHNGRALQAEIDRIAKVSSDPSERFLAVLRFVQGQVRYLGIEIGPNSHAPHAPELVLARRYGDCKDKSLLMVAMLRALGIEAHPALVNSRTGKAVRDGLPAPGAFDHVIVRARFGGRSFWVDPTRAPQRTDLDRLYQPDFGYALVIDAGTTALTPMPVATGALHKRTVTLDFDSSAGFDKPAKFVVRTTYEAAAADEMRYQLKSDNLDDLQRQYLNYYARRYPKISQTAPMDVEDDESINRLVVTEHYRIAELWTRDEQQKLIKARFSADEIRSLLRNPVEPLRKWPLALFHPQQMELNIDAKLPESWAAYSSNDEVLNPSFEFRSRVDYGDRQLSLRYSYRSLGDNVPADEVAAFVTHLDEARGKIGWILRRDDARATPPKTAPPRTDQPRPTVGLGDATAGWAFVMLVGAAVVVFVVSIWRNVSRLVATMAPSHASNAVNRRSTLGIAAVVIPGVALFAGVLVIGGGFGSAPLALLMSLAWWSFAGTWYGAWVARGSGTTQPDEQATVGTTAAAQYVPVEAYAATSESANAAT